MQDVETLLEKRNRDNKFANFVGIKTLEVKPGYAKGELVLRPEHMNILGSVHGGCIYTLADVMCGSAGLLYEERVTTVSSSFHFLSPALRVEKLIAEATEIKHGKKIRVIRVDIFREQSKLIASGTFTFYHIPADG
jgi:acyl-CoA thioesterase